MIIFKIRSWMRVIYLIRMLLIVALVGQKCVLVEGIVTTTTAAQQQVAPVMLRGYPLTSNNVSLLYLVGVEGVGHHGVAPAIATIARSCGHFVEYESPFYRSPPPKRTENADRAFQSYLNKWRSNLYVQNQSVVLMEDSSFPTAMWFRNSNQTAKKQALMYDLEWIYERAQSIGMSIRFLHLKRDFYRTVASHSSFDGGFQQHAEVLRAFLQHIGQEYQALEGRKPGMWRQIHYEWFTDMRNCTALVSAVIDFAGWDHCDVNFACEVLHQTLRNSTNRPVNATELSIARQLEIHLPIPDLDISGQVVYNVTRVNAGLSIDTFVRRTRLRGGREVTSNIALRSKEITRASSQAVAWRSGQKHLG